MESAGVEEAARTTVAGAGAPPIRVFAARAGAEPAEPASDETCGSGAIVAWLAPPPMRVFVAGEPSILVGPGVAPVMRRRTGARSLSCSLVIVFNPS